MSTRNLADRSLSLISYLWFELSGAYVHSILYCSRISDDTSTSKSSGRSVSVVSLSVGDGEAGDGLPMLNVLVAGISVSVNHSGSVLMSIANPSMMGLNIDQFSTLRVLVWG